MIEPSGLTLRVMKAAKPSIGVRARRVGIAGWRGDLGRGRVRRREKKAKEREMARAMKEREGRGIGVGAKTKQVPGATGFPV